MVGFSGGESARSNPCLDFSCAAMRIDPYPRYADMRKTPVCQLSNNGLWLISDYHNARQALKDHETFSSIDSNLLLQPFWMNEQDEYFRQYPLIFDDPPRHTQYRHRLRKNLLKNEIHKQTAFMRQAALNLIGSFPAAETFDFINVFSRPYVGLAVNRVLGIENRDSIMQLHHWVRLLEMPPSEPGQEYIDELHKTSSQWKQYFKNWAHSRRQLPKHDFLSPLFQATIDGSPLTDDELGSLLEVLILGGYQAPTQFLCHTVMHLAHRPDLLARLYQHPDKIPAFIEEALRFNSSVHFVFRKTRSAVTLSGTTIPEGAPVIINIASANRDPSQFSKPDVFDLERTNLSDHIAFGYGIHNCLGAALARVITTIALQALIGTVHKIACPAPPALPWFYSLVAHGVSELPVSVQPRPTPGIQT